MGDEVCARNVCLNFSMLAEEVLNVLPLSVTMYAVGYSARSSIRKQ